MSHSLRRHLVASVAALLGVYGLCASVARAEPVLVSVEAQGALAMAEPQSSWFGPGGSLAIAAHYPLTPVLLVGLRLRAGLLSDGDPPSAPGVSDPGRGSFELAALMLRVRPLGNERDVRLGSGLFFDLGAGGGITGRSARPSLEAGLGYGFALGSVCLAPTLRYLQVVQPNEAPSGADARLLLAGVELSFHDRRPRPPPARPRKPAEPSDRDHDGIDDAADSCPDEAEDLDGFEDDDGCPDPDNDKDGVDDAQDRCPDRPEDRDGFEDRDGCPDPDNDGDGVLDGADKCPDQAEVINGVDDEDGCPDEGEIVFENGRIVLEERVLFDFERARVKTRARPVLQAIVKLRAQHPEWVAIHIEGHSDARGNRTLNHNLSERRARNVMRALIELGIPAEQLSYAGYGATRLRDQGTSEEAHQRNRRVEFVVETRKVVSAPTPEPAQPGPAAAAGPEPAAAEPAHGERGAQAGVVEPSAHASESESRPETGAPDAPRSQPPPAASAPHGREMEPHGHADEPREGAEPNGPAVQPAGHTADPKQEASAPLRVRELTPDGAAPAPSPSPQPPPSTPPRAAGTAEPSPPKVPAAEHAGQGAQRSRLTPQPAHQEPSGSHAQGPP